LDTPGRTAPDSTTTELSHPACVASHHGDTAFLPDVGVFVRWIAADSEQELLDSIGAAVQAAVWQETLVREVPGALVLCDSAVPGDELEADDRLRVELAAGRYVVRAAQVTPRPRTALCLVQVVPSA
jgi:hypothetical protein